MNSPEKHLDRILRDRGLGWALDMFAPSLSATAHYLQALERLEAYVSQQSLGTMSFSPESVEHLIAIAPHKADAFLQALVSNPSTPMLCAAWRLLQGMEVEQLEIRYSRLAEFMLRVVLNSPYGQIEEYVSSDINDIAFLRHLGKSTIDGRPFLDGFYPLRQT